MREPCPACRAAVKAADATASLKELLSRESKIRYQAVWDAASTAQEEYEAAQHTPDCPNQERP